MIRPRVGSSCSEARAVTINLATPRADELAAILLNAKFVRVAWVGQTFKIQVDQHFPMSGDRLNKVHCNRKYFVETNNPKRREKEMTTKRNFSLAYLSHYSLATSGIFLLTN